MRTEWTDTLLPSSSSHILNFRTLDAMASTSFWVSSLPTAAKTRMPLPMEEMRLPSTETDADLTRCITAIYVSERFDFVIKQSRSPYLSLQHATMPSNVVKNLGQE